MTRAKPAGRLPKRRGMTTEVLIRQIMSVSALRRHAMEEKEGTYMLPPAEATNSRTASSVVYLSAPLHPAAPCFNAKRQASGSTHDPAEEARRRRRRCIPCTPSCRCTPKQSACVFCNEGDRQAAHTLSLFCLGTSATWSVVEAGAAILSIPFLACSYLTRVKR